MLRAAIAAAAMMIAPAAGAIELHPLEAYTVEYEVGGSKPGTIVEHSRNHGNQQARITDTTMTMAGMRIREHTRVIIDGASVTTVDLEKKTVTRTTNPLYESMTARMKDKDGMELAHEMMRATGFAPSGATETILGESCEVWRHAQIGQEVCFTADGLTLRSDLKMGPVSVSMRATKVQRGDGGDDSLYQVPEGMKEVQAPDLGQLMGRIPKKP
jgi:hypothetical protein